MKPTKHVMDCNNTFYWSSRYHGQFQKSAQSVRGAAAAAGAGPDLLGTGQHDLLLSSQRYGARQRGEPGYLTFGKFAFSYNVEVGRTNFL